MGKPLHRQTSLTPKRGTRRAQLGQLARIELEHAHQEVTLLEGEKEGRRKRRVRPRRLESVLADVAEERVRAEEERRSWAFMRLPRRLRRMLILSTYLLAFVLAASSHILYAHARAAKRSVYVAADGRGEQGQIHLLSIPDASGRN
jgi:hypothetical protein